ncbi:MAG: GTP-binding protein, partial [Rhodospirillales bacterium]
MSERMKALLPNRLPVSVVTGFLGSGKTTLINYLVKQEGLGSTALIINEFGEIGIDNLLVETAIENTLLLENGCICCSLRGDLIDTICDLFAKVRNEQIPQFSRILIETTGLADPGPIINSIQSDKAVIDRCLVDRVITVVDGVQGKAQTSKFEEAMFQIVQADIGLISKSDLISSYHLNQLRNFLHRINPTLIIKVVEHG